MKRFFNQFSSFLVIMLIITSITGCTGAKDSNDSVISINLQDAKNIGSVSLILSYNPKVIEVNEVDPGKLAESAMLEFNIKQPGEIVIGIINSQGITGSGDIARLSITILEKTGTSVLSLDSVELYDATTLVDVRHRISHGSFAASNNDIQSPVVTCQE